MSSAYVIVTCHAFHCTRTATLDPPYCDTCLEERYRRICLVCGASVAACNKDLYCSAQCSARGVEIVARLGHAVYEFEKTCEQCRRPFTPPAMYESEWSQWVHTPTNPFCSRICLTESINERKRGTPPPPPSPAVPNSVPVPVPLGAFNQIFRPQSLPPGQGVRNPFLPPPLRLEPPASEGLIAIEISPQIREAKDRASPRVRTKKSKPKPQPEAATAADGSKLPQANRGPASKSQRSVCRFGLEELSDVLASIETTA